MRTIKIFSAKQAAFLCRKGFRVINQQPNLKKPWLDYFVFIDTPELQNAMHEYSMMKTSK